MEYIDSTLLKDEKIVFGTQPHRVVFLFPIILIFCAVLLYGYLNSQLNMRVLLPVLNISFNAAVGWSIMILALFYGIKAWIFYRFSEYGITNKRIIMKTGWIQRHSIELFLEKVEAIYVNQSVAGRLFGYGTVAIVGTGGSSDPFLYVPDPLSFRKRAQQQIDLIQHPEHA